MASNSLSQHFQYLSGAVLTALVCASTPAVANPSGSASQAPLSLTQQMMPTHPLDATLLAARDAARRKDQAKLDTLTDQLSQGQHPLALWAEQWRWRLRLNDRRYHGEDDGRLLALLQQNPPRPLPAGASTQAQAYSHGASDLLRRDYLAALVRRDAARAFDQEWARGANQPWPVPDDDSIQCYAQRQALANDPANANTLVPAALQTLREAKELGDGCLTLAQTLQSLGKLRSSDLYERLRWAAEQGATTKGKALAALDPQASLLIQGLEGRADTRPPRSAVEQEAALLTVIDQARDDPTQAAQTLQRLSAHLNPEIRSLAWLEVAQFGARKLMPMAVTWAKKAESPQIRLNDEALSWIVRAAIRHNQAELVLSTTARMSDKAQADPTWTYWQAKALAQSGKSEAAREAYKRIATGWEFYNLLAQEELGLSLAVPPVSETLPPLAWQEFAQHEGARRAWHLLNLGLRPEGSWEFNRLLIGMSDTQRLVAAEAARQFGFLDRMISAAERTRQSHNFGQRFPTPLRNVLAPAAQQQGLSSHWVYGLIRQESRFVQNARSSVGASGLMQLMPATAKMVAKKIGLSEQLEQIDDPSVNAALGTGYLRMITDQLDGSPMLATAGYNAGPGRARTWRASLSQVIEGAAYAESIPFSETRDYVKKVLTNTVLYAAVHEGKTLSLKALLGEIGPDTVQGGRDLCCGVKP